jgi:hypothetical protein
MTSITLFGANNPSGAAFLKLNQRSKIETWGRTAPRCQKVPHTFIDLSTLPLVELKPLDGVIVSFAPIWLLASFLKEIVNRQPKILANLVGLVACSSSSFLTKRFAFNEYDRRLASSLHEAHISLEKTCLQLSIPIQILAPTMVYGYVDCFQDKNIGKIVKVMRRLPTLFLPSGSGMRQPIHASQLAAVASFQSSKMILNQWTNHEELILSLGGDETLSYETMILRVQESLSEIDRGRRCKIIKLPDKLFWLMATPLIIVDLKKFEAVLRISSNLSGFTRVQDIIGGDARRFPILPLSTGS